MKWISVAGIRKAEAVAFAQRNIASYTAMCRAGAAVALRIEALAKLSETKNVVVLCGPGNNGGDGFVAARCLYEDGYRVHVLMTCVGARLKGDALRAWKDMTAQGVESVVLPSSNTWLSTAWADAAVSPRKAIIVDALLGIGAHGPARGPVAAAIHWINSTNLQCPVVAIDVPSGMDADAGSVTGEAVRADVTITFSRPKIGFSNPAARDYLGILYVVEIGLPVDLLESQAVEASDGVELITGPEVRNYLRPERRLDSHKGLYGHALIVGGSERYPHAPVFSALAAFRAGCGLVSLDVPEASRAAAAQWVPGAVFETGSIAQIPAYDAVAIGPGLGSEVSGDRMAYLRWLVSDVAAPRTVVDADALTLLAKMRQEDWLPDGSALRLVLTPHPGEAGRLLNCTTAEIQRDRPAAARAIASRYHAIVVLKGYNTLVAEPGGRLHINMSGNPGMATAGTGDVLTGIIAGLLARGLGTEDAACLAVYQHAMAGDAASVTHGQESLIVTDLFDMLRL